MGLLDKLLRRGGEAAIQEQEVLCPHTALVPKWDRPEDIGKEELIVRYHCEGCGQDFTKEEGERLLKEEVERLRAQP